MGKATEANIKQNVTINMLKFITFVSSRNELVN